MADVIAADQLRLFIERIERLEDEKKGISDDIKDVYAESKSNGFDTKTIRAIVRLRKMEKHHREEAEMLLETYKHALGMDSSYDATPLGAAAASRSAGGTDVVKLAAEIHAAGGRMVGDTLAIPMAGLKDAAEEREAGAADEGRYQTAIALVVQHKNASSSWLQRQMGLGYNASARLVERMEKEGIVSRPDHVGRREVLIDDLIAASKKSVMAQVVDAVNGGALGAGVTASLNS